MNPQEQLQAASALFHSRMDRVARSEALQKQTETPAPEPEPDAPLVRIDILPSGKPQLIRPETMTDVDAILLGMQGLGQLVLDIMGQQSEEAEPT